MSDKRTIKEIIVHCSATPPSMDIDVDDIRRWHVEGNSWRDIGYHLVILRDGTLQKGRPVNQAGAHCRGHNSHSIGICLVGGTDKDNAPEFNFTADQARTLRTVIDTLRSELGEQLVVSGHRDHNPHKACPCFDVRRWLSTGAWEA